MRRGFANDANFFFMRHGFPLDVKRFYFGCDADLLCEVEVSQLKISVYLIVDNGESETLRVFHQMNNQWNAVPDCEAT